MAAQAISSSRDDISHPKSEKAALDASEYGGTLTTKETENGESREVFQVGVDGVEFRTVSWQRATVVFLKINFAMSILAIPGALAALGSLGGSLAIVGFTSLNTCKLKSPRIEHYERVILTRYATCRHGRHLRRFPQQPPRVPQ